jgi:spoIIIJ-associated protein
VSESENDKLASSEERVELALDFLDGILERMGIEADLEVTELDDRIRLDIQCDDVQRVIGRRGQLVDALQHLVAKRVSQAASTEGRGKPIVVDAGGYRDREIERLESLASRMAQKALKQGGPVELSPMSAHDRRIVHMALAETEGVSTRSEGEGDMRHVVVVPEPGDDAGRRAPPAE